MHRIQTIDRKFHADTVVPPEWLNAVQEEVSNVIEFAGLNIQTSKYDLMTQLWQAIQLIRMQPEYDIVVTNQSEFNAIITRNGANDYQISDDYKSVLFQEGAYLCYGATSFLSGGDVYGVLKTNDCAHLVFENGAYFDVGGTAFHLETNTDYCRLDNVYIKGNVAAAVAATQSFLLNAYNVTYNNCKTSDRLSTTHFNGFKGSATAAHNYTSRYSSCSAHTLTCATAAQNLYGFNACYNLSNCLAYAITSSGAGASGGFISCYILSNCSAYNLDGTTLHVFGFYLCDVLSSCQAYTIDTGNASATGFFTCNILSSCYANDHDSTGAAATSHGFHTCTILTACQASGMTSGGGGAATGFTLCSYGSSLYTNVANSLTCDWMDTSDINVVNKFSCPAMFT
jgi:hypothetical protein